MKTIGFIGYGSMGSMLIKGFVNSGQIGEEQIIITRKNKGRLDEIKALWPKINITEDICEVAGKAQYIFICVKPLEFKNVLDEIKPFITEEKHIISIAGSVSIENIESIVDCKITRTIPTVVSEVNEGITLVCHNSRVGSEDARFVEALFGSISKVTLLNEEDFGFGSELTSCAPGLIAAIFKEYVEAALRHSTSIGRNEAEDMVARTLLGTAKMALECKIGFSDIVTRVATKGGITEEGVKAIKSGMPGIFDEMYDITLSKRELVEQKVQNQFKAEG